MDNPFIKKQLDAKLDAERDIIALYAESCFLNIQVLYGDLSDLDRLEQLSEALTLAEQRIHGTVAALLRIGVPANRIPRLDEQERLDLFEAHFTDPEASTPHLDGLFAEDDLREMLNDLSGPLHAELIT